MLERLVAREIDYLWSRLARATRGLEALAPLWSRGSDPRVVRVVEAAAYSFARIKEKLEDDIPEISHALVASALPEVLRPMPSATVLRNVDERAQRRNVTRHDSLRVHSRPIDGAPCVFEAAWPLVTAPIALERAALQTREPGLQTLTLLIGAYGGAPLATVLPDPLRVFVDTNDPLHALDVVHALRTSKSPVRLRVLDERGEVLTASELPSAIRWTAVDSPFRFLPGPADRFGSGSALRALHSFPELFAFFEIAGLPAALAGASARARRVEVTIRLGETVNESSPLECHLDCVPAVNAFDVPATMLPVRGLGNLGVLRPEGRPQGEVFHVGRILLVPGSERSREVEVRLWERELAREIWDDELYLRLERRAAIDRGPTELYATLVRPASTAEAPVGELRVDLLATDGARTETLLRGDVAQRSDVAHVTNLTRVTSPHPPRLDARLPWRMNAYARMPVMQLARAASLASYVALHDPRGRAIERDADPASAGFVSVLRKRAHHVQRDEVIHGDEVDLVLDEAAFGGRGATWLVGELVARALAERADRLRFTQTRWTGADGSVRADYGRRDGARLPPPFG